MSAFVVEDGTINRIVSWLNVIGMAGHNNERLYTLAPITKLGYDLSQDEDCKRLANDMFKLNCESINQRYGTGQAEQFRPLDFKYIYSGATANIYQALKSLRCLIYQCCEGDIPESNALFEAMERVSMLMCYHIVTRSKEYEACEWD